MYELGAAERRSPTHSQQIQCSTTAAAFGVRAVVAARVCTYQLLASEGSYQFIQIIFMQYCLATRAISYLGLQKEETADQKGLLGFHEFAIAVLN